MSAQSNPASVTVVNPQASKLRSALAKACCFSIRPGLGMRASKESAAPSINTPVGVPSGLRSTSPPGTSPTSHIDEASSAARLASTAWPSIRCKTTGVLGCKLSKGSRSGKSRLTQSF